MQNSAITKPPIVWKVFASRAFTMTILLSGAFSSFGQVRLHEARYAIIHIPGLGGGSDYAEALNDLGSIAGESLIPGNSSVHAIFWDGKYTRDLGTLGGNYAFGNDVNNSNWVVGSARRAGSGNFHAFVWKGSGELIPLKELDGATNSAGFAINGRGQMAGGSDIPDATIGHAVLWEDEDTIIDLGTLGGPELDSSAFDINENGFVTGWSGMIKGGANAFLWDGNEMTYLGSLGGGLQRTEPQAINDSNVIVGWGNVNNHNKRRPCVYFQEKWYNMIRPITDKGFDNGTAWDINNANQIVGEINHEKTNDFFGFIAQQGDGIQILNDLIPPHCDYDIKSARAINEHGQIAANGVLHSDPNGSRMFLLTPVDPELTLEIPDGPLQADAINTLTITNAQPGATIKFFYGKKGGGKRIPGCDALAAMTQIDDPVLFGEAVADADGNAELDIYIPPHGAAHKGFLIQAIDFDHCEESQLVLKKVE